MIRFLAAFALACALAFPAPVAAAPLAIIGDCIATAPAGLGGQFRGAVVRARVGLPSRKIVGLARPGDEITLVSSGSNDIPRATPSRLIPTLRATLVANLLATRARLTGRVIWIEPRQPDAAAAVREVAAAYGDRVVAFAAGRDGVHPASYPALAAAVRPLLGGAFAAPPPRVTAAAAHRHH